MPFLKTPSIYKRKNPPQNCTITSTPISRFKDVFRSNSINIQVVLLEFPIFSLFWLLCISKKRKQVDNLGMLFSWNKSILDGYVHHMKMRVKG